jgi:hypothetical protein
VPIKNKNILNIDQLGKVAGQAGLILMTAAVTFGMLELPEHGNSRIVLPNQPALALAGENTDNNNPLRREREETAPHYISYTVAQRTPGRTGRI